MKNISSPTYEQVEAGEIVLVATRVVPEPVRCLMARGKSVPAYGEAGPERDIAEARFGEGAVEVRPEVFDWIDAPSSSQDMPVPGVIGFYVSREDFDATDAKILDPADMNPTPARTHILFE